MSDSEAQNLIGVAILYMPSGRSSLHGFDSCITYSVSNARSRPSVVTCGHYSFHPDLRLFEPKEHPARPFPELAAPPKQVSPGLRFRNPANNRLIVNSVGLHTWETVYIVHKGANHGYGRREGTELLKPDNTTAPLPADDRIPVQIGDTPSDTLVAPTYPVIQYGHDASGGDSIGSGFLYNGNAIPSLRGKYVFTDLTTGRIWWADYNDMLAADDGQPGTLAQIHEVKVRVNGKAYDSMFPIVEDAYHARGGKMPRLSGRNDMVFGGRSDVRFSIDASGELYLYSKADGMIRKVVGATGL